MRRKFLSALAIAAPVIIGSALAVLAYTYSATLQITNNTTMNYGVIGVSVNASNTWMANNGFFHSTANDTRVQTIGGIAQPHMVADNKTLTAVAVGSNSQTNLQFTAGNSELPSMSIIPGYGGYVTTNDTAALEPGSNSTISVSGFVDTTRAGLILGRTGSANVTTNSTGNVTLVIGGNFGWVTPASVNSSAGWATPALSIDGNTATAASYTFGGAGASTYLIVDVNAVTDQVGYWVDRSGLNITTVDIDAYYDGGWNNVFSGVPSGGWGAWSTANLASVKCVIQLRIRGNATGANIFYVDELRTQQIGASPTLSVAVASADMVVAFHADSTNMWLTAGSQSSANATVVGIPDNGNVWKFGLPYMDYIKIVVGGAEKLWYQPTTMILGTILPDRDGTKNGDFTWGSNPSGVTVSLGSLVSSAQPAAISTTTAPPRDILPTPNNPTDLFGDGTVSGSVLTNPFRPLVTMVSDNTTLTELQVWRLYGFGIWLLFTVWVMKHVRKHQLITGIASAICVVIMIVWNHNIFPFYLGLVAIGLIVAGWVAERSPIL